MPAEEIFWDPYLPVQLPGNQPNTPHMLGIDSDFLLLGEDSSHVL